MSIDWTCPHCNRAQTVTHLKHFSDQTHINISDLAEGAIGIKTTAFGCASPECQKVTIQVDVGEFSWVNGSGMQRTFVPAIVSMFLIPRGRSKPQPDCIPLAIREDYYEACLIRDDSPKASATLARRCLQGMIRDFCKITASTLYQEIQLLLKAVHDHTAPRGVTIESVEAIDHVRGVGNIGAHMEKDVDLIISVEPDEAQTLINLIELLFEDWYVEQDRRSSRFSAVKSLGQAKKEAIATSKSGPVRALPEPIGTAADILG